MLTNKLEVQQYFQMVQVKHQRVLVFAKGPKAEEAKKAGADFVGAEELIPKIQNENWFEYDVSSSNTRYDGCCR